MTAFGTRSSLETFIAAQEGNRTAKNVFMKDNSLLLRKIIGRYGYAQNLMDDLYQEAAFGMLKALEKFDISRGLKFSTYAVPWIRVYVERYIQANMSMVSMPTRTQEIAYRINAMSGIKTPAEISEKLKISRESVEALQHIQNCDHEIEALYSCFDTEHRASMDAMLDSVSSAFDKLDKKQQDATMLALDLHPDYDTVSSYQKAKGIPLSQINKITRESLGILKSACNYTF
ncbi:sigma-70 family RNA polymerase sigma factor (plasmid) [Pseudomonas sp. FeN3W]|nr:sigma-70 family RNA polymerase sigma factor [Pseudomonas sp. FeN3W]